MSGISGPCRSGHLSAAGTFTLPGEAKLRAIIIGTGTASSVVTVKDSGGTTVSVINAANQGNYWFGDLTLGSGTVVMATANSDCTILYV